MALLNESTTPRHPRRALALALSVLVAGCAMVSSWSGTEDEGLVFSHWTHMTSEDGPLLEDCAMCHFGAADSEEPGMPPLAACQLCHEEDEETPPEERISSMFDEEGNLLGDGYSELAEETVFSHLDHVEQGLDCAACHGDMTESRRLDESVAVSMNECMQCHEQQQAPNDCTTCHTEYGKDKAPGTHDHNWEKVHGQLARAHDSAIVNDCAMCHQESECNSCHREQQPDSHNNYFRLRGHAPLASMDRESCLACHRTDFCSRCHSQTRPLSHSGASFGGTRNNHCITCHEPLKSTGCFTCHKSTRSHLMAPPKPAGHNPAMNCRLCHGAGLPLRHVDNGSNCNSCHR